MIYFENKKVLFIDLDNTLIKTISGKTFPEDITDFRIQLPVLGITSFCTNYLLCEIGDSIYCPSNDSTNPLRKPNIGMLKHMSDDWGVQNKQEMIMIGDASGKPGDFSDSDKKCAENFGIDYIDVRDFLNLNSNTYYK